MLSRVQILFSTPLPGDFLESFASPDLVLIGLPPSTIALWEPSLWTRVIFDRQLEKDQKAIRTGYDKVWGNSTFVLFTGCLWNLNKQWRQFYQHQLWRNNMRNDRACMILVPQFTMLMSLCISSTTSGFFEKRLLHNTFVMFLFVFPGTESMDWEDLS